MSSEKTAVGPRGDGWACCSTSKPPLLPLQGAPTSPAYVRAPQTGVLPEPYRSFSAAPARGRFRAAAICASDSAPVGSGGCRGLAWGRPAAVRVQRPGPSPGLRPRPRPRPPPRPVLGAAPREGRRAPPCGKPLTKQPAQRGMGPGGCETRSGPFARDKTQARRLRSRLPRTPQARGPARLREAVSTKGLPRSELTF